MQQELDYWRERRILRLVIGTKHSYIQQLTKENIDKYFEDDKERKTSCNEYFLYCFKADVKTVFGETFAQMVEAMEARQNLGIKQLLQLRTKRKGSDGAISLSKKAKAVGD